MKNARLLSACLFIVIYSFSTVALHAQSTPCASITRAPQVLEALTDEHSQAEESAAQEEAISAADMTRLKFTPILIHEGDALYVEYRGKDFTINAQYANKDFTSFDSPPKASSEQWRKGVLLLDHLMGLNQKLVRLSVTAKNPGQVSFRNIRIIRAGKPAFEFARLASYGKPQIKKAIQKVLPCKPIDDLPIQAEYSVKHGQPFVRTFSSGVVSGLLPPLITFQTSGSTPPPSFDLNHFKWNGKEFDAESGLYNFGARYYSPNLSRFTSFDPKMISKQKMFDPQQWNMYSFARNNPTTFTDPNGQEVRLADGLSRSDQNRMVHNLAAAYRKESGRAAINGLAKSDIVYTYRTGHLSDKVVNVGGQQVVGQRFGETEPHLHGATDSTGQVTSVVRTESTVDVTFDFGKLDAAVSAFMNGQRQAPPTEQHVNDHELAHQVDVDKDPAAEHNQSTEQAEKKADDFANSLEKEKNSMSQKDAEKSVKELLHQKDQQ